MATSANNGSTLAILDNVETAKVLANVLQISEVTNEAAYLSRGSDIITATEQIATSKKANILLPLMGSIKDVKDVLIEARDGGVKSKEGLLNEAILNLANEKITDPLFIRLRDGEVIGFDQVNAYSKAMGATIATAVTRIFYENIVQGVKDGVAYKVGTTAGAVKGAIVDAVYLGGAVATAADMKDLSAKFVNQIRTERRKIKAIKDKFVQAKLSNKDFTIIIDVNFEEIIENDARYNQYTEKVQSNQPTSTQFADGHLDGSEVMYSKQLPAGVAFIILLNGSATSLFTLRNNVNLDKVVGVNAFIYSTEFDEGTGTWLPQFITVGSSVLATNAVQARQAFDALTLTMTKSVTQPGNTNAGLEQTEVVVAKTTTSK